MNLFSEISPETIDLPAHLTVIILTYNSESSISNVIESVHSIGSRILIVDSFSSDKTLDIARSYSTEVVQHEFVNYAAQRNWAQAHADLSTNDWVLHLDSDEVASPELTGQIKQVLANPLPDIDGYLIKRLTYFLGKPIRHGHLNPNWHLRLFKAGSGQCEERLYDQHFIVQGKTAKLKGILHDLQLVTLEKWTYSHNRWSTLEAVEVLQSDESYQASMTLKADLSGDPRMQKRWLKNKLYYRTPLFGRAFLFFLYSYILRLGFLDGKVGLIYGVLQAFWFRFLVDAKIYEQLASKSLPKDP